MTVWTLLVVAVLVSMLVAAVEVGHLWLARAELENAMEAAALAAAQEWASDPKDPQKTLQPRLMGVDFATSNTVTGSQWNVVGGTPFTTNHGPGNPPNENASCAGNLIFGAVSLAPPFSFRAGTEPQCEHEENFGEVGLTFTIQTPPNGTTFREATGFSVKFLSATGTAYITKLTWELDAAANDNGEFDVNTFNPPLTENLANGTTREGWGPYFNAGASTGINAANVTFSPDGSTPGQARKLEVNIANNDFGVGDELVFGVDTDMVGNFLGDSNDTADDGGDFGSTAGDAGPAFRLTIEFSNGATAIVLGNDPQVQDAAGKTFTPAGLSRNLIVIVPATGEFGVRAQATASIKPVFSSMLGLPLGPFTVQAQATARAGCSSPRPQLIRIDSYSCP